MSALFHYCTVQVLHSVISTGRVRLSSVRHANDATEGTLLSAAVSRLAIHAQLSADESARLQHHAELLERQFDGMALCLSEDGDLLSQWRGYADDGRGIAIGFNRDHLNELVALSEATDSDETNLALALYKAKYEDEEHDAAVRPLFDLLQSLRSLPLEKAPDDEKAAALLKRIGSLQALRLSLEAYDHVYSLKHRAFSGEREWRLLQHFDWSHSSPTGYQPRPGRLVPYTEVALSSALSAPITEVVLGPRHTTPPDVIARFLEAHGHQQVAVRHSSSPYRRDA